MNHHQTIAQQFLHAYRRPGGLHWAYNGLSECVRTWSERGIIGLPDPTPQALELLREDIAQDDAFLASLRG